METLSTVLEEFRTSREKVEFQRDIAFAIRDSMVSLYDLANQETPVIDGAELDKLLSDLNWAPTEEIFGTSGIQALIYGGEMASIESEALRTDLADWPRRIDQVRHQRDRANAAVIRVWMPYLQTHGDAAQLESKVTYFPGHPDASVEPFPIEPTNRIDHSDLLRDRQFRNIIVQAWVQNVDSISRYDEAERWIDTSMKLVQDQLDR